MTSPCVSLVIDQRGRLFSAADLARLPTHLPSGDVDYELDKGRLIVVVPSGYLHGAAHSQLIGMLFTHAQQAGFGKGYGRVGLVLSRDPDTVFAPDVVFITGAKLPVRASPQGYLETIPDLVIEIRSRNDTTAEVDDKVTAYLSAGVRVAWIADPAAKAIAAHRIGDQPRVYNESDTLTLDDLFPDFRLDVAEVFRD